MNDGVYRAPSGEQPDQAALSKRRVRRWWLLGGAVVLAAAGAVLFVWSPFRKANPPDPFALAPIASSPYWNTKADARYIGSAACRACHKDEHASFRRCGMGRSSAEMDAAREPPDGAFDHPASKRRYQVRRQDGALWHRELLLTEGPQEVVLSEYPVQYVVGSGRHARAYLVGVDGFLVQSPVTWYAARRAWDLAPGYDDPQQPGFARAIGEACLFCHTGRAETLGQSTHRMHVTEAAIGCERCHGPGSLHVGRHENRQRRGLAPADEIDYTIVNPARLSRDLAEAVCQQCHLETDASVPVRGRKMADFRPGLRGQDFRQVYVFEETAQTMTVVGHVEQMHQSRCYQRSDTFSCLTCHNPHDEPAPEDRVAHYKAVCISCHAPARCKVSAARRRKESPNNDCVQCHMPRSPVDVPHLAFTHHRVGIHSERAADAPIAADRAADLRPFLDLPGLSAADQKRSLGEGYRLLSIRDPDAGRRGQYRRRALDLLTEARAAGLSDAGLEAGLAQLRFQMRTGDPLTYAESALAYPEFAGQGRCDALFVVAQERGARGHHEEAVAALRELTELRREAVDWLSLAKYNRAQGDERAASEALLNAVRINPRQWDVHRYLAEQYRQQGDAARAAWHQQRAVP